MITISLSPNTESDDVLLAIKLLLQPWKWKHGDGTKKVNEWFQTQFPHKRVYLYNSGRSAEFEILRAFGIGRGDEVIVQAFTCVAVPNSVLWTGAKPIYADIDESYNLNVETIKKVVTNKTKAIIVQHTFGIPAEIDEIVAFAKTKNILVIEDCAHALGATYKNKHLGTWGDAAFFSFGRDKVVSSVFGGAAIISEKYGKVAQELDYQITTISQPSYFWIFQQVFHPVAFSIILPLYSLGLGKVLIVFFQKLHWLSFPVYQEEKEGKQPSDFPRAFPNVLAIMVENQLKKLDRYNIMRQKSVLLYRKLLVQNAFVLPPHREGAIYLRFPVQIAQSQQLLSRAKENGFLLGNWYHSVIDPKGVDYTAVGYLLGSCPNAERLSKIIVNLPTRLEEKIIEKLSTELNK